MRAPRLHAVLLCLALVTACQSAPPSGPAAPPSDGAAGPAPGGAPATDGGTGTPAPGGGAPGVDGTPHPGATSGGAGEAKDDLGGLGGLCRDYLRAPNLVVEIDWRAGAEPTQAARAHLLSTLATVTGADVTDAGGAEITGDREVWTTEDLRAEAAAHRSHYSNAERMAVYVLSVRGRFQDEAALGVAHRASEFAIFPDRIGGLSALLGGRAAVERSVLVHEMGHLLCLVNIRHRSAFDREDPEHPNHSSDRASVMHWAIETSAVGQLFNGPPPDSFTEQDRADLAALRAG